jgi:hypothetical protein
MCIAIANYILGGVPGEKCSSMLDQTNILYTTVSEFIGNRELKCNTLAQTNQFKRREKMQ